MNKEDLAYTFFKQSLKSQIVDVLQNIEDSFEEQLPGLPDGDVEDFITALFEEVMAELTWPEITLIRIAKGLNEKEKEKEKESVQ